MRKLLMCILIALLLLVTVYSIWKGLSIGNIKILGFNNIKAESEKLKQQTEQITKLKEQDYKKALSDIEKNAKSLVQEKEKYATLVSTSTDSEIEKATHSQKYEQDFLWAKIGNHATAQGVSLKFDIAIGAVNKENYDLYFTVDGSYTNITEFVMALENDNLLGFKIENFKLVPSGTKSSTEEKIDSKTDNKTDNKTNTNSNSSNDNTNNTVNTENKETSGNSNSASLQATFKVTDVSINIDNTKITSSEDGEEETTSSVKNTTKTNTNTLKATNNTVVEGTVAE